MRASGGRFVIPVVGNGEIACCEYAIEHFDTPLLVHLGHSSCGAFSADDIYRITHIGEAVDLVRKEQSQLQGSELIAAYVKANVLETVDDLKRGCPRIAGRVREVKLKLPGVVYTLDDGRIAWL